MKRFWLILGSLALVVLLAAGIYFYRHRYVRSDEDLLAILPGGDLTTFYANVQVLRESGMLKLLTGTRVPHEPEYDNFIRQINFDYSRDLDRLAGAVDGDQVYFVLRGRFDWEKLRRFPASHGGSCVKHTCKVPAGSGNRWFSFHLVQPDVLALALSADTEAVKMLQPPASPRHVLISAEPVWIRLADSLLKHPQDLPLPVRIFAISVQSANPVVLSVGAAAEGSGSAFKIALDAACANEAAAETIRDQLESQTKMLRLELKRERQQANPGDLTGLLTAGSFQIANKHVLGSWPVRFELLKSLQ